MEDQDLNVLHGIVDARGGFGHREHLELAWNYLRVYGVRSAHDSMTAAIRHLALQHEAPDKYHETITRSWVHLVALHRADSAAETFDEFVAENPALLDRQLLDRHYSRELLGSPEARTGWVEPDLRKLPALT